MIGSTGISGRNFGGIVSSSLVKFYHLIKMWLLRLIRIRTGEGSRSLAEGPYYY